ncbi:MAG: MFS transporter [Dehalococcoidales bacterium]
MSDIERNEPPESFVEKSASAELLLINRKYIFFFCAATFFFWTALYLYVPILPVYAQSLGSSLSMVGVIVASYAMPQLLLRIPVGLLFDAITRRRLLLAGGIATASVGALGLGLAPNPWFLFLARIITGIGAATWVTFTVYFTAYYPPESTRRAIGIINFVQGTAIVVATACGGVIAEAWGSSYTFWGATLLGIAGLIALLSSQEPFLSQAEPVSWKRFKLIATFPPLLMVSFMGILAQFANWAGLFGFIPVYADQIGASSADLGIITMLTLASSAVAALIVAPVAKRWGSSFTILLGAVLMGSAIFSVPLIHSVNVLKTIMVVNGLGRGVLSTILMALSIQAVAPQQRATAMGVYQAAYSVGMILGPLISGSLADSLGLSAVFYLSASLCLLLAAMAYLRILVKRQKQS